MRKNNAIVKKMMLALLGLVMSVIAGSVICTEGSRVMAAELDEAYNDATYKDFLTVEHTQTTAIENITAKTAPDQPTTTACKDWLFAGWYSDAACTTPICTTDETTEPSYAKFVPTDVLSVKCQILTGTTAESEDTNLRFTTSVDTDQYYRVGFEISRPGKTYTPYETSDAFKRIEASEEAGVAFKYSPKVINTKSEAFVTYTITGIPNTEENRYFDTVFMAKPYWKTLDGTKVYGVTRYVKVSDFYNDVLNIPVQVEPQTSYTSSDFDVEKYTDATTSTAIESGIDVYYNENENYAAVAVSGQSGLASATKYEVAHNDVATTYVQRNLLTEYTGSGSADSSWYDVNTSATEFVIATSADLYGFATVINDSDSFTNRKFYLVADIEANKGKAEATGWNTTKNANGETFGENESGTDYPWTSIAISGHNFKAIFDGQGHTISGIIGTQGFFQYLQGGKVKNFRLTNSYFAPTGNYAGSVVARAYGGSVEDVYSEAIINSSKIVTGGIVGGVVNAYTLNITNCCYSGNFSAASGGSAGILGKIEGATAKANITSCQFLGQLTTTGTEAGGFVGTNVGTANITDCQFSGQLTTSKKQAGGFVGYNNGTVTITNSEVDSDGQVTTTNFLAGGFIGQAAGTETTITNSQFNGTLTTASSQAGGFIGNVSAKSTITNSMFNGILNTSSVYAGGFIGNNETSEATTIENGLFDGTINITVLDTDTTTTRRIGGFVGYNKANLSVITSLNSGTIIYEGTKSINGVCRVVGYNDNASMHLNKVYSTMKGFNADTSHYTVDTVTLTKTQEYSAIGESNLVNKQAFFNTKLFEGDTTKWALVEGGTPVLKTFIGTATELALPQVPESADISWYGGVKSSYTICDNTGDNANELNVAELYGLAFLVDEGVDFAEKTVYLAGNVTVNDMILDPTDETYTSEEANWSETVNNAIAWTPIGSVSKPFAGTFDGKPEGATEIYTISGLYVSTSEDGVGLFAATSKGSTVKNLKLLNSYFGNFDDGDNVNYTGSIIGKSAGAVDTVYSDTYVYGDLCTGGLIGHIYCEDSTAVNLSECWFDGSVVSTDNHTGGIVGSIDYGTVNMTDCLNTGTVKASDGKAFIGGLIGGMTAAASGDVDVTMTNCLNTGVVNADMTEGTLGKPWVGSIWGRKNGYSVVTVTNVYATNESCTKTFGGTSGLTGEGIIQTYAKADISGPTVNILVGTDSNWTATNDSTPELIDFSESAVTTAWYDGSSSPYTITTAAELRGFSYLVSTGTDFVGETVELGNDITLSPNWTANEEGRSGIAWSPIGNTTNPFAGTFDGNGHTISGLYVDSSDYEFMGMFGVTASGSELTNFRITNSYFKNQNTSNGFVGSVAGKLCGNMSKVYSNAIVKSNNLRSAGMVAYAEGGEINISDCWFDGQVLEGDAGDNKGRYIGGIVSSVRQGVCNITNTLFTGEIITNHTTKGLYVGGIVAETYPADSSITLTLDSVVSAGKISGKHNHIACFSVLGQAQAKVLNSGTATAEAIAPQVTFKNVFATRDCYPATYGFQKATGEDDQGNSIVATGTRTGDVLVTAGQDRFIGYGTQEATNSSGTAYALTFSDDAWSMRRNDVPIPTCFEDFLKDGSVIATTTLSETTLAGEIGLDYFTETKDVKDALAYGAGNYVITYDNIESTTYSGYLVQLGDLQFEEYANNEDTEMYEDGVKSATYSKKYVKDGSSEWVLNIVYVEKLSKLYISINTDEKSLDDNLKGNTENLEKKNDISLGMLKIYGTDENGNNNGNSFVFRLPNGHFIINDGGRMNKDTTMDDATKLVEHLKELAGENEIIIDAWIVSHFHGDHWGLMESFFTHTDLRNQVYVESIYLCEPSVYALDYWEAQYELTMVRMRGIRTLTKQDCSTPSDIHQMHMGQRYYFTGMTMDVLDTQEQHHVETWDDNDTADKFNTSSTNCIFTFEDGNQETKKVLIGGDATNVNMYYMINAYGQNNKTFANLSVLAAYHHGHNTTSYYVEDEKIDNTYRIQYVGTEEWSNFLINNTNNVKSDDNKVFDVVLFPYRAVYKMEPGYTEDKGFRYYGDDGEYNFAYNIGDINQTFIDNAKMHATYAEGNVIITFGENLQVNGVEY